MILPSALTSIRVRSTVRHQFIIIFFEKSHIIEVFICYFSNVLADEPLQEPPRDENTNDVRPIKDAQNAAKKDIEDRTDEEDGEQCPLCNTYFQRDMNVLAHLRSEHGLNNQRWAMIQNHYELK